MTKVVINNCFGGFDLSKEACELYWSMDERKDYNEKYSLQTWYAREIGRDDPTLIQVVEQLGAAANGSHAELRIVEIPDGVNWYIEEYDGNEHVAERHRTWS